MGKITKIKANKLATELVNIMVEERSMKKKKEEITKQLQTYCKENGTEVINEVLLPYEKQGAAKLVGAEGKALTELKGQLVENIDIQYLNRSLKMPALLKGFEHDRILQRQLKKLGLKVQEGDTTIHFKHV